MKKSLIFILLVLFISGSLLTLAAYFFGVFPFDIKVEFRVLTENNPLLTRFMSVISIFGDWWIPVILIMATSGFCAYKKWNLEAFFVLLTLTSGIIAGVIKMLVGRSRPPTFSLNPTDIFQSFNEYAYPSGHVPYCVVFLVLLLILL